MDFRLSYEFDRTEEQFTDQAASWRRGDRAFFAAGACHILAYAFAARFPEYSITYVGPRGDFPGTHVFAESVAFVFDHNGLTKRMEFLDRLCDAYATRYPGWGADFLHIDDSVEEFCRAHDHLLPEQFAELPWPRADRYIDRMLYRQARKAAE